MFEEFARLLIWLLPIILLAVIILPQMIRILREYQRGVIFRLGKLLGTKGPGMIFLIPIVDRMVRMDLRVVTIDVARQEVMTRDNVPMTVDAVVYFRVIDPAAAVVRVENFVGPTACVALFAETL
jgi:regulator of protease activity HflC (stomatin/prohibitin superfamily)